MSQDKIKVVIIHNAFLIGGAENMVFELAKNLDKSRVEAKIITLRSRFGTALEEKVDKAGLQNEYAECSGRVTLKKLLKVYRIIKREKPDIIHAHMAGAAYGMPWILTHKTKMVITPHTSPDKAFNKRTTAFIKALIRLKKVVVTAVSEENRLLIKEAYKLKDEQVKFVNNGVDLYRFYKKEHEGVTFINVGRQDENKNQKLILKLFARLCEERNDIKLILCGDGECHEALKRLAKDLAVADKVQFTGNVADTENYLSVADIYLQSSHREGLPLSIIEGMAACLPIISTDVGGISDIVKDNGILVADNDEEAYFNAMRSLCYDANLREKTGKISKVYTADFSSKKMAETYTEIFRQNIKKG